MLQRHRSRHPIPDRRLVALQVRKRMSRRFGFWKVVHNERLNLVILNERRSCASEVEAHARRPSRAPKSRAKSRELCANCDCNKRQTSFLITAASSAPADLSYPPDAPHKSNTAPTAASCEW